MNRLQNINNQVVGVNQNTQEQGFEIYKGQLTDILNESNLGYCKISQLYERNYEAKNVDDVMSFYQSQLKRDLKVVDLHLIYYNRIFLREMMKQQNSDIELIKNNAEMALVFNANKQVQGHIGKFHGGFVAALLDDFLCYLVVFYCSGDAFVTIDLQTKYKGPLNVGQDYICIAKIIEDNGKNIITEANIMDSQKRIMVKSRGVFRRIYIKQNQNFDLSKNHYPLYRKKLQSLENLQQYLDEEKDTD